MRGAQVLGCDRVSGLAWRRHGLRAVACHERASARRRAGRVAWFDITTSDLAGAKTFYGGLFDWRFNPLQGTDAAVEIVSRDLPIGTIRRAEGAITAFNGVVYVQVTDLSGSIRESDVARRHDRAWISFQSA